jgi:ribonuclease HII
LLIGIDEAGRGPLAGPIVCAAVAIPNGLDLGDLKITDSKKLTERQRVSAFLFLCRRVYWQAHVVPVARIEELNVLKANLCGMKQAMLKLVEKYGIENGRVIIDGDKSFSLDNVPEGIEVSTMVKADSSVPEVSCASIIAKVIRDYIMFGLDVLFPKYEFRKHKGYGTQRHIEILKKAGPTPWHRKSFVKKFLSTEKQAFLF